MTLSEKDGKLYYELWLPLLEFTNQKYGINKKVKKMAEAQSLEPVDVKAISDKLCENAATIDEYLLTCPNIPEDHRAIIASWKRSIKGKFIIERHLKRGSIFISMENESDADAISQYDHYRWADHALQFDDWREHETAV